ncbi:MAG TPA: ATP-dependent helicase HrpB [Longimicrobiales bacterium]|nr:ATP-dependent helicase HrpB [Longimicrobiales bacterium]
MTRGASLPIDDVLPLLAQAVATHSRIVLHAPPGAGKTTRVPLALLDTLPGRVIMLEPRRLAARAAASWMSRLLGDAVGGTVGYRVRHDTRVGARTRIEIVTEGVLTRMLQDDPSLDGVSLVIFDEFHERSIHADTALALTLQAQSLLRPDLRLLIMSATLDVAGVVGVLDAAAAAPPAATPPATPTDASADRDTATAVAARTPIIHSEGRAHAVDTIYLARPVEGHIEAAVASRVARAHDQHEGDILVFLPGVAEIRRTADHLSHADLPTSTTVIPLYGDLPQGEQDRAISPSPPGHRKIVLATSIAETSLTIEGIRIVVDSGLMRVPRFSPRTGMTRLATVPVSRAAADQRRGRAGRLAPGVCYRMWTEGEHAALLAHRPPEILEADLAPLALDLAAWGVADPGELHWIDPPPAAAFAQAQELLRELDALDDSGRLTEHGASMAKLSVHPRLAHMLLRARTLDCPGTACDIAALLSERDVLRADDGAPDPDVRLRLPLLRGDSRAPIGHRIDRAALHRVRAESRHLRQRLHVRASELPDEHCVPVLLAFAYPDRIAIRRGSRGSRGRFVLRGGGGATVDAQHILAGEELIVAAELGGHGRSARVFLAAPIDRSDVESHFAAHIETTTVVEYDADSGRARAREVTRLGAMVLGERPVHDVPPGALRDAMLDAVRRHGLALLNWTDSARSLRERLAFLHHHEPDTWPDVSDESLVETLEQWLAPWLASDARPDALARVDMTEALLGIIGYARRADIERLAPTHVEVPSGSRVRIDYSDPAAPVLAVRLQEMFGAVDTPRIAGGRVPLTLHLLSPARRPVQVTRDLASFWSNAYFDVRKDLRGRYPKHYWPENPLEAEATRRARPRGK